MSSVCWLKTGSGPHNTIFTGTHTHRHSVWVQSTQSSESRVDFFFFFAKQPLSLKTQRSKQETRARGWFRGYMWLRVSLRNTLVRLHSNFGPVRLPADLHFDLEWNKAFIRSRWETCNSLPLHHRKHLSNLKATRQSRLSWGSASLL